MEPKVVVHTRCSIRVNRIAPCHGKSKAATLRLLVVGLYFVVEGPSSSVHGFVVNEQGSFVQGLLLRQGLVVLAMGVGARGHSFCIGDCAGLVTGHYGLLIKGRLLSQVAKVDDTLWLILDDQAFLLPVSGCKARAISAIVPLF